MKFAMGVVTMSFTSCTVDEVSDIFTELCIDEGINVNVNGPIRLSSDARALKDSLWETFNVFFMKNNITEILDFRVIKMENSIIIEGSVDEEISNVYPWRSTGN